MVADPSPIEACSQHQSKVGVDAGSLQGMEHERKAASSGPRRYPGITNVRPRKSACPTAGDPSPIEARYQHQSKVAVDARLLQVMKHERRRGSLGLSRRSGIINVTSVKVFYPCTPYDADLLFCGDVSNHRGDGAQIRRSVLMAQTNELEQCSF